MRAYKTVTSKCSKTSYKIEGLIEGMLYYFRVLPENLYGVGEPSETPDLVLVCEVPMPPHKLDVIDITKTTVTLGWEKPDHDGGSRLTAYVVEACKFGTDKWMKVATLKMTDLEYTITALTENEQFLFRVRAVNSRGQSEPKELVSAVTVQEQRGMLRGNLNFNLNKNVLQYDINRIILNICFYFHFTVEPQIDLSELPQKSVSVLAGKALEIELPFVGRPPPKCAWYFNDKKIKIHDRVKVKSTKTSSKLTVLDTTIDDSGEYTLEVTNIHGVTTEIIKAIVLCKNV